MLVRGGIASGRHVVLLLRTVVSQDVLRIAFQEISH
ncbi:hypothetical protein Pla108_05430 [Botrimarina colliarenosi]|uniref:Uncharacterized protein n=1 Tax=Botrimarina colliarenosi TaxID=2528001 RepID=A0A5C6AJM4_9BACT|nr:hypothetical protein Pla108_05430 [Botrimarina colliarenosi]